MGTETSYPLIVNMLCSIKCVKLNNPLMGTETSRHGHFSLSKLQCQVKLNNPLMGTEIPMLSSPHLMDAALS